MNIPKLSAAVSTLPLPKNAARKPGPLPALACPECGSPTGVADSRPRGDLVRRRRYCTNTKCGTRFTTYEGTEKMLASFIDPGLAGLRQRLVTAIEEIDRLFKRASDLD